MIKAIKLREILDSRGNPTIEFKVSSDKGIARASAPSGASVGAFEVPSFPKQGVKAGIKNFREIEPKIIGSEVDYHALDSLIKKADPTREKFGGNLSVAFSIAIAKLSAEESGVPLYKLFTNSPTIPYPLGNVIGGGVHAGKGSPTIQEFLAIPVGAKTFKEAFYANSAVHKIALLKILEKHSDFTRGRDDEGAWAPKITSKQALQILSESCSQVKDEFGFEIKPALDLAASEFYDENTKTYNYKGKKRSREEQINFVSELVDEFSLYYVEDPLEQNDFDGFAELTKNVGNKCLVVGDDLTTTNVERLRTAIERNSINSIIIKPNQIGSLSETESVIKLAGDKKYTPIMSHRSGETTDNWLAHLAVGFSIPIIKTGIVGGERLAKLNELLRIEGYGVKLCKLK